MTTVVVMAKEPRPGRVKTRLCPPCTPQEAARLAAAALADTLAAVEAASCARRLLAFDGCAGDWHRPGWDLVAQVDGELGQRLGAAATAVDGPVLLVGMDTPQLSGALLDHACERLAEPGIDAVLGPADDGGYWAVGFHRPVEGAFDEVPMSTAATGRHQRARLDALGLRVGALPRLRDVDTFADARAVAALIPHSGFAHAVHDTLAAR